MKTTELTLAERFFTWVVRHPKRIVAVSLAIMLGFAAYIPEMTRDTRSDAFLADDNPALVYREKVKEIFGLSDPMVIAVVAGESIFTVEGLNTIQQVTDLIMDVDNIDPDGITSLATENNIVGTEEGMEVDPFFEDKVSSTDEAHFVRDAIRDFPLYQGSLVARDESASLIVAELLDELKSEQTYTDLITLLDTIDLPDGITLHVAGEGAISGYLGSYIDLDAQRLNPIAALVITTIIFIAFLRFGSTFMANMIIGASAMITLGAMAAADVPFYVITNALPVILIGIAVADSIHIYSEYFGRRARYPGEEFNVSIVHSLVAMWRPITLTTLTTVAGFMGLYFAAYMPPFKFFGLYTAIGVSVAWIYSLTFLPAAMSLIKTEVNPHLARRFRSSNHDIFASAMVRLGKFTANHSKAVIGAAATVALAGIFAASQVQVDEDRIETFHHTEPLYIADKAINSRFDGTNYLDVVIETNADEGIFAPHVLNKVEAMQVYAESLSGVLGSTSIVDYLKQMNRALHEGHVSEYVLPQDRDLIAQYFLLYSASSDPTDFEEEVDYDYRLANVRITMAEGAFSDNRHVVEAMEAYAREVFNDAAVRATVSGRIHLNYHWIKDLGLSHFSGMAIALFLVWLVSSLLFRSLVAGSFALVPVATSILLVYSTMVALGMTLGIGNSMFAAVAIGLGVDFAIHTIDRFRSLYKETPDMTTTFERFYPTTGRALFFNLQAIALGFGVLVSSKVVPLNNFGIIVAISVTTSFLVSLTLLPALIRTFRPRFITAIDGEDPTDGLVSTTVKASVMIAVLVGSGYLFFGNKVQAEELPDGRWIFEQVNAVDEGESVVRKLFMKMVDRRGKERTRDTISFRKYYGEEKRTVLYYLSPKNVKDTGFLTYDYPEAEIDDDQWLYLPAMRKSRRISASDRGDYFLGTDFSYEDIKKEGKVELSDYTFTSLAKENLYGRDVYKVELIPVNDEVAKELGYGKTHAWVDMSNWIIVKAEYWDIKMNPLKTLVISDIRQVDGIWTRHHLTLDNHKTGHHTEFVFSEVDYAAEVTDKVFSRQALTRGAPR